MGGHSLELRWSPCSKAATPQNQFFGRSPRNHSFLLFDKSNLAVVGKNFAVLQSGRVMRSGLLAWLVWALIHIQFLAESSLRFSVFFQWVWTYLSAGRGDRLISYSPILTGRSSFRLILSII
jgi:hypothetical protein